MFTSGQSKYAGVENGSLARKIYDNLCDTDNRQNGLNSLSKKEKKVLQKIATHFNKGLPSAKIWLPSPQLDSLKMLATKAEKINRSEPLTDSKKSTVISRIGNFFSNLFNPPISNKDLSDLFRDKVPLTKGEIDVTKELLELKKRFELLTKENEGLTNQISQLSAQVDLLREKINPSIKDE